MSTRICAAVTAAVALTAGCGAAPATPPAAPPTTSSSVAVPTPAELDRRAKAALPAPDAFGGLGGEVDDGSSGLDDLPMAMEGQAIGEICGALPRVEKGTSAARTRSWSGGVNVFERVHVTSELPAKMLVATVRQHAGRCAPGAELALTELDGVDESFAYCQENDPGAIPWSCQVALARGSVFALVSVNGESEEAASAQLTSVLPIVAEPFVKA